jgi:hypothetical protein
VRAPELAGDVWLNTGGRPLKPAELRGRIVLLNFWTSGCVSTPSRRGRHWWSSTQPAMSCTSPRCEGHAEALRRVITDLVEKHDAKGTLRRGGSPYVPVEEQRNELRFPSKAVTTAEGRLLVADTGNHSIVEFASDGETVIRRFGSGERGAADGAFDRASFTEPAGIALLPNNIAEKVGYHVVVADTAGHLLRGLDLNLGEVSTVVCSTRSPATSGVSPVRPSKGCVTVRCASPSSRRRPAWP